MAGVRVAAAENVPGSGPKRKAQLLLLHTMIDSYVDSTDWASIVAALVKRAKLGDVQAFRRTAHLSVWPSPRSIPIHRVGSGGEGRPSVRVGQLR